MSDRLSKAINDWWKRRELEQWVYGKLGKRNQDDSYTFDVPGRATFVYVTMRSASGAQTTVAARNDAGVEHAPRLNVRMKFEYGNYVIYGKSGRQDLGSNPPSNPSGISPSNVALLIHSSTLDTTPLDADEVPGLDSSASFSLVRWTWTTIKAFLKTYFDTVYTFANIVTDHSITYTKIQNVSNTSRLLGRTSPGSGTVEEIVLGAFGATLINEGTAAATRGDLGLGNLAVLDNVDTGHILSDAVDNSKLANMAALTVKVNNLGISGDPIDMATAPGSDQVLREEGGNLSWGTVATGGIGDNVVTNNKLDQMPTKTMKGNNTASTANAADLTVAQIIALLGLGSGGANDIWVEKAGDTMSGQLKMDNSILMSDSGISALQDYLITQRAGDLTFQAQGSGIGSVIALHTQDGDATDTVAFILWGRGTPSSITNRERGIFQWDNTNAWYSIRTEKAGTGTARPIRIYTEANTTQFVLGTDGNAYFGNDVGFGGETSPDFPLVVGNGDTQLHSSGTQIAINNASSGAELSIATYNSLTQRTGVSLIRARGTVASPTAVVNGDSLGFVAWKGYDGSAAQAPALIESFVDDTVSSGHVPASIKFITGTVGSDRKTRILINSSGQVSIGNTADPYSTYLLTIQDAFAKATASVNSHVVLTSNDGSGQLQMLLGLHGSATAANRAAYIAAIEQGVSYRPLELNAIGVSRQAVFVGVEAQYGGATVLGVRAGSYDVNNDAAVGGVLMSSGAQVDKASGVGGNTLVTITIPGNTLAANGQSISFEFWGHTNSSAENWSPGLTYGGTTVIGATVTASKVWRIEGTIMRAGASSQRVKAILSHATSLGTATVVQMGDDTFAKTLSSDQNLVLSAGNSGSAGPHFYLDGYRIIYHDANS